MTEPVLSLNLKLSEVNLVFEGVGHLAYGRVEALVANLRAQVMPQLSKAQAQAQAAAEDSA